MWKVIVVAFAVLCANVLGAPPVNHRPLEFDNSDAEVFDFEKGLEIVENSFYEGTYVHRR